MTANELAVDLELQSSQMEYGYAVSDWKLLSDSAIMLRQQQEKINRLLDQYQRLNENLEMWKTEHFKQQAEIEALKLRELTDEEIKKVWLNLKCSRSDALELIFARAILRKASEK